MIGIVKWFSEEKGYGFLQCETGEDVFVHASALLDPEDQMLRGRSVEFEVEQGPRGAFAANVTVKN